ncbi:MAG TPA: VOC family protein [Gemmatimonadota bacterium]|nr:VOC family protein [Gemmatimonadota bacterium]
MAPNMAKSIGVTSRVSGLYVCIDVDDVERGIAFYTRGLGLQLGRRFDANWVELDGGPVPIDLLGRPGGTPTNPDPGAVSRDYRRHWTPVHLDFVVDDLEAAVRRATEAGATVEGDTGSYPWGRIARLADPFGHGFCLLEFRGRGYGELPTLEG